MMHKTSAKYGPACYDESRAENTSLVMLFVVFAKSNGLLPLVTPAKVGVQTSS